MPYQTDPNSHRAAVSECGIFRGPRLVLVESAPRSRNPKPQQRAWHGLELAAIRSTGPFTLRRGAMAAMLDCLGEDEQIDFVHQRCPEGKVRYRFGLEVLASEHRSTQLLADVDQGLKMMSDNWLFAPRQEPHAPKPVTHAWKVTLGAVRALPLPKSESESFHASAVREQQVLLPNPVGFPNWLLTSVLNEDLGLPDWFEIRLRLTRKKLSALDGAALQALRYRLLSGSLALFQPRSPLSSFSGAPELSDPVLHLLGRWMQEPTGFAIDFLVRASGPVSGLSFGRVVQDMVGDAPYVVDQVTAASSTSTVPISTGLQHCLHRTQVLPAVFPEHSLLPDLGVDRLFPMPKVLSKAGVVVGTVGRGNEVAEVRLPDADRTSHLACLGASGTGKSTFLLNLLAQDMAASDRRGVGLIDPHGTLYRDALRLVPKNRVRDVICVDVDATDYVSTINPLAGTRNNVHKANFVANETVSLIDTLFEEGNSSGPAARTYLKIILKLTRWVKDREATFLDALRMLEDSDYLDFLRSRSTDRVLNDQVDNFRRQTGEQSWPNWAGYLIPKLSPFATSPVMRRMLNHAGNSVDFGGALREGKILLVSLNQATVGSVETRILGNIVMNQLFYAATQRGPVQGTQAKPFHLIVDEAASLCTDSMLPMWAQARKYGLSITTANQNLGQLRNRFGKSTIGESLMGNTSTKVFFRLSGFDAEQMLPYSRPLGLSDMVELPTLHAVAHMPVNGTPVPAFVMQVHRPQPVAEIHAHPDDVIAEAKRQYGQPINEVVESVCAAHDLQPGDVGLGDGK